MRQFIPNVRIGRVQGGKAVDVNDCDVLIGMLQTLSMRDVPDSVYDGVGLCVFDECHLTNTQTFSNVLKRFGTRYMVGLSATPRRRDGLERVITSHIGDIMFSATREKWHVRVEMVKTDVSRFRELHNRMGKVDHVGMITMLTKDKQRNNLIANLAIQNSPSKVLVLSERREHLKTLMQLIQASGCDDVGLYVGGMRDAELATSEACSIVLGTYSIGAVGLDIRGLNRLILATPRSEVTQSCGRILRDHTIHEKVIVDVVDSFSVFMGQSRKRMKCYKEQRFVIGSGDVLGSSSHAEPVEGGPLQSYCILDEE